MDDSKFLEGLKSQFEDSDAELVNWETEFEKLETWDSLTQFSIVAYIEDDFNVSIEAEELEKISTPKELLKFLKTKL